MSLTIFIAICILGTDLLIYLLFQWTFGEKYRAHSRRMVPNQNPAVIPAPKPYLVQSHSRSLPKERSARFKKSPDRSPVAPHSRAS